MTTDAQFDPLWMPLLTHYADTAGARRLDKPRTAAHIRHLTPHVRQYLVSGTTGDGWVMSDAILTDWLDLLASPDVAGSEHKILVGALGKTTAGVIERARRIEAQVATRPLATTFAGLTICPPVDADAGPDTIAAHYRAVLEATAAPLAIYQLPQVTGCEIAPDTFADLVAAEPRIGYFKDTSGGDAVVKSGVATGHVVLLRGAEGDYHRHLKPAGGYDGWLLSTANGFAPQLRAIADAALAGDAAAATARGERLSDLVGALFDCAGTFPLANAFSDMNRAVDHLFAHGKAWRKARTPLLADGSRLPEAFIKAVEALLASAGLAPATGYLAEAAGLG